MEPSRRPDPLEFSSSASETRRRADAGSAYFTRTSGPAMASFRTEDERRARKEHDKEMHLREKELESNRHRVNHRISELTEAIADAQTEASEAERRLKYAKRNTRDLRTTDGSPDASASQSTTSLAHSSATSSTLGAESGIGVLDTTVFPGESSSVRPRTQTQAVGGPEAQMFQANLQWNAQRVVRRANPLPWQNNPDPTVYEAQHGGSTATPPIVVQRGGSFIPARDFEPPWAAPSIRPADPVADLRDHLELSAIGAVAGSDDNSRPLLSTLPVGQGSSAGAGVVPASSPAQAPSPAPRNTRRRPLLAPSDFSFSSSGQASSSAAGPAVVPRSLLGSTDSGSTAGRQALSSAAGPAAAPRPLLAPSDSSFSPAQAPSPAPRNARRRPLLAPSDSSSSSSGQAPSLAAEPAVVPRSLLGSTDSGSTVGRQQAPSSSSQRGQGDASRTVVSERAPQESYASRESYEPQAGPSAAAPPRRRDSADRHPPLSSRGRGHESYVSSPRSRRPDSPPLPAQRPTSRDRPSSSRRPASRDDRDDDRERLSDRHRSDRHRSDRDRDRERRHHGSGHRH